MPNRAEPDDHGLGRSRGGLGGFMAERRYAPTGFTMRLGLEVVRLALSTAQHHEVAPSTGSVVRVALLDDFARGVSGDLGAD